MPTRLYILGANDMFSSGIFVIYAGFCHLKPFTTYRFRTPKRPFYIAAQPRSALAFKHETLGLPSIV